MKGMQVCYHHGGILGSKKARKARRKAVLKHGYFSSEAIAERKQILNIIKRIKQLLSDAF